MTNCTPSKGVDQSKQQIYLTYTTKNILVSEDIKAELQVMSY